MLNNNSQEYYNLAITHYEKGEYDSAIENFQIAVSISPEHAEAHYNLGVVYYKKELFELSEQHFKKAAELNPEDSESYYNLGLTYYENNNLDLAIKTLKEAANLKPDDPEIHHSIGSSYYKKGDFDLAEQSFKNAISINPELTESYKSLSATYIEMGEFELAEKTIKMAIEINPDIETKKDFQHSATKLLKDSKLAQAEKYYEIGTQHTQDGDIEVAIENFKKAIENNPDHELAKQSLYFIQEMKESMETVKSIDSIEPADDYNADSYYNLGSELANKGNYEGALENFKKALKADQNHISAKKSIFCIMQLLNSNNPKEAENHYKRGIQHAENESYQEAIQCFIKALAINPNHENAQMALSCAKKISSKPEKKEEPYKLGMAQLQRNEYEPALENFKKALTKEPNNYNAKQALYDCIKKMNKS